ncbi:MAG: ribonuclease [Proteobacteria bacterium SG_bin9]|nr:MAG: ribonuclease [Proteobacteria bacterium SG_bin9]
MANKMLIDATHPEETRVVVVRGNRVEEFDFESAQRKQLRGNIYLAKVTRVEPSLQAAFIEYGGNRHGFLAFSEIHPDYYQIPVADRQALIEADERAHREAEEESENRSSRRRSRHRNSRRRGHNDRVRSEVVQDATADEAQQIEGAEQPDGVEAYAGEHDHPHETHDHADGQQPEQDATQVGDHARDGEPADQPDERRDETASVSDERPEVEAAMADEPVQSRDEQAHDHDDERHIEHADGEQPDVTHADDAQPASEAAHGEGTEGEDEDDDDGEEAEEEQVESVGGEDVLEEVPERAFRPRRQYKIQEVIKRRQVMLVQVVKEERGNKGAALTTYLSLAGRYAVLMPNTARGGGISRKITSAQDRTRLKEVVQDLDVPEGMGIILRTAGAARTKPEIKRDFEYLLRMWETVRDLTLKSQAPTLVYEEGSLIKRSLRDLYNKEIDEIQVSGDGGYEEARDFMKMLMPSNVRAVKQYRDGQPLFSRMGVESQLDAMFTPTVQLRSGGYIVINQTEALVSIDVNSGRSTREHNIEDTALKTNLEAAEEVARQLRLRDLAGLIVIDFIDMDEKRNNRAVERKLSDCLRQDRARIQVGRISHFGLLEMSRQRIRASVLESSTEPCPHCGGSGHVRSVASVALQLLRSVEESLMKGATHNLVVRTRTDVALYVLNHKRGHLRDLENGFKVTIAVIADATIGGQQSFVIDRGEQVHTLEAAKALLAAQLAANPAPVEEPFDDEEFEDELAEDEADEEETAQTEARSDGEEGPRRSRRRRRRRGRGGDRERGAPQPAEGGDGEMFVPQIASDGEESIAPNESDESDDESGDEESEVRSAEQQPNGERRPRRRGRRGGRRRRGGGAREEGLAGSIADELEPTASSESEAAVADFEAAHAPKPLADMPVVEPAPEPVPATAHEPAAAASDETPRRRSTVREKVSFFPAESEASPAPQPAPEPAAAQAAPAPEPAATGADQPRKAGWWSRRFGNGE